MRSLAVNHRGRELKGNTPTRTRMTRPVRALLLIERQQRPLRLIGLIRLCRLFVRRAGHIDNPIRAFRLGRFQCQ